MRCRWRCRAELERQAGPGTDATRGWRPASPPGRNAPRTRRRRACGPDQGRSRSPQDARRSGRRDVAPGPALPPCRLQVPHGARAAVRPPDGAQPAGQGALAAGVLGARLFQARSGVGAPPERLDDGPAAGACGRNGGAGLETPDRCIGSLGSGGRRSRCPRFRPAGCAGAALRGPLQIRHPGPSRDRSQGHRGAERAPPPADRRSPNTRLPCFAPSPRRCRITVTTPIPPPATCLPIEPGGRSRRCSEKSRRPGNRAGGTTPHAMSSCARCARSRSSTRAGR